MKEEEKHLRPILSAAPTEGWEETYTLHPSGQNNRVASMVEYWWKIVRDFFWKSAKLVCGKILNPSKGAPGRLWKCRIIAKVNNPWSIC